MRGRLITALVIGALLATGTAAAQTLKAEDFILTSNVGFSPKALPSTENATITVRNAFHLSVPSGGPPPVIDTINYLFDRHGKVDVDGLPVCTLHKLQGTDVETERSVYVDVIVGQGTATAVVDLPEQEPFSTSSPITLFNGPAQDG